MKKLFLLLSIISFRQIQAQTWVTIPDANFVTYLQATIPSAMNGNQMNTSSTLVTTSTHKINVFNKNLLNLFGIQFFTSLTFLDCSSNTLDSLPTLPNSLDTLLCRSNNLNNLPALPNSLTYLDCSDNHNHLYNLPVLPSSLTYLNCNTNIFPNLPSLPSSLTYLNCSANYLTNLPPLPNSLTYLSCNENWLTNLPALPNSLQSLSCSTNSLTTLPALPNTLQNLSCSTNSLTNLPALPNTLQILSCDNNSLPNLPSLPNSLQTLSCDNNSLPNLPPLPNSLTWLHCKNNHLTSLPSLPNSLQDLDCGYNNITCFPTFPNSILHALIGPFFAVYHIQISHNPFNCLPNYLDSAMDAPTLAFPLCAVGNINNCPVANGITQINFSYTQIEIYPNPTSDQFYIETNATDKLNLDIYDVNGRHVFSANVSDKSSINVTTLDNGIYTLTIKSADRMTNKKLVIAP